MHVFPEVSLSLSHFSLYIIISSSWQLSVPLSFSVILFSFNLSFFPQFSSIVMFLSRLSVSLPQLQNFPSLPQFPPISFFLSLPVLFISHHSPDFPSPSSFSVYGLHNHLSMAIDSPSSPNSTWPLPSSCPNSLIRYVAFYFKFLQEASKQVC